MVTENEFKKEIAPEIMALKKKCIEMGVPFFACFFVPADCSGAKINECITPAMLGVAQKDDMIQRFINVYNGFETIPPHEVVEVDFPIS